MSYATMQDALFALDLADSELWDRPRLHPDEFDRRTRIA